MKKRKKQKAKGKRGTIPRRVGEEWRLIEGTEDFYISNLGRFRHKKKLMKYAINHDGYYTCNIGTKKVLVHRLVALAFIPNPENKPVVDHIDGDKLNNHISNLRWLTIKENTQAAVELGLIKGSRSYPVVVVDKDNNGYLYKSQTEAAKQLDTDVKAVNCVIKGTKPHVKGYKCYKLNSLIDKRGVSDGDNTDVLYFKKYESPEGAE